MRNARFALVVLFLVPTLLLAQKTERQKLIERYAKELKSRDAATRVEAAENLGDLEDPQAVEPLVLALEDRDPYVRSAAASALWSSSKVAQQAIPALTKTLADPEPSVVIRAAGALIAMDVEPSQIAEPLRLVLRRGDEFDRFLAARALIGVDPAEKLAIPIVDYLRLNAEDSKVMTDWSARRDNFEAGEKALRRLAETQDRGMIAPLMARLKENPYVTEPILLALGLIKPRPDRWIETLLGQLGSPNADVRETAVELLGKEKGAADVKLWSKPVAKLVSDRDQAVRREALRSLKGTRGLAIDAISPVVGAVRTETDAETRALAAEAVGEIADAAFAIDTPVKEAAAKEALPVLTNAIERDASIEVRGKAMRSLDKLQLDSSIGNEILARVALEQKDRNLRLDALQLLNLRGRDAAPVAAKIAPLQKDPDELIRRVADSAIESMGSERSGRKTVTTTAAVDPAARDKALETLREYKYEFTEEAYFSSLNEVELDIVTAFLDAGMSPNHRFASGYGNPALRVVLEADEGCQPSVRPSADDAKQIVKLLLARGGNPNIADDRGNTPLMTAAENCDPEIVKLLLAAGADMNAKNGSEMTAFEFGLWNATDGAAALAAAGFTLSAEKVKIYTEAYAKEPKKLALVKKATKATKTTTPAKH